MFDVEPTENEWFEAIGFLTRTGHISDERRQEFVLVSAVLRASMQASPSTTARRRAGPNPRCWRAGKTVGRVVGLGYAPTGRQEHPPNRVQLGSVNALVDSKR